VTSPAPASLLVEGPQEGVLRLTLNDPRRANPLSRAVFEAITAALGSLDPTTLVVVLTGAGNEAFASGADMSEIGSTAGLGGDFGAAMDAALVAIEACRAPVIARIQGHCLGAGYQLALACDLRVAAATARLGVPASRFGLLPGPGPHRRMLQQLGPQVTRELMLTGRSFSGDEALARRLADIIVPAEGLDAAVDRLVMDIVRGAPITVRNAKRMINGLLELDGGMEAGALAPLTALSDEAHASEDVREGLAAFFERRRPRFRGR
jgi:enoyl-CoA hydratase